MTLETIILIILAPLAIGAAVVTLMILFIVLLMAIEFLKRIIRKIVRR